MDILKKAGKILLIAFGVIAGLDTAVEAMLAAGMTVSYNKFETGGHSFGIGVGTPAEGWLERAIEFTEEYLEK